ncbi:MAG: serine hydrolase [Pseudomonadota bacterium]
MIGKAFKVIATVLLVAIVAVLGYLIIAPPELLRVATNYSAKIVCSNVFIANRDADETLSVDVQAPGHPILKYVSIQTDQNAQTVTAKLFGFLATAQSQHREGVGCSNLHGSLPGSVNLSSIEPLAVSLWPQGSSVNLSQIPEVLNIVSDEAMLGEGYRAVVVVKNGRIIAENYADGFDAETPLLGWSMSKSVTAVIIGTLIKSGQMSLGDNLVDSFPEWGTDARKEITVESMLAMSSGLDWNEAYGDVSDVIRMLFLNDDMAGYAARSKSGSEPGSVFNYSSGTTTLLARAWQDRVGENSLGYPREKLFSPLGMTSAVMEPDANNTFVGSSYMYANAHDWARFGQFLMQKGVWDGKQLLPFGYTDWMFEPVESSDGKYTRGQLWRRVPGGKPPLEDAVWMSGHDGQSVGIFPSHNMVLVRLGLTPSKLGYSPRPLAEALIKALGN